MSVQEINHPDVSIPGRLRLREKLACISGKCTGCGLCLDECVFLRKYGTPKEIAERYNPAQKEGQTMPFECCLCRLCDAVCPTGIGPGELFLEMRREAVDRGRGSFPEHKSLLGYERTGMSRLFSWYGLPHSCRTVLFPGCSFPGTRPDRTKDLYAALRRQDPCLGIVLDCCGRISRDLGREAFSRSMLEEMSGYLLTNGVQEVLVVCPNCYDMFKEYGGALNVRTVYEVLPEEITADCCGIDEIAIHDPCGVRFHGDCHQSVRRLLTGAGIRSRSMEHSREKTLCCGNGAGVEFLSPELSGAWLENASREADGRTVTTYCAGCSEKMNTRFPTVHVLDVLYDPQAALTGKSRVSKAPFTFLNRLSIKRYFKKFMHSAVSRERTFRGESEGRKGRLGRMAILAALIAVLFAARSAGIAHHFTQDSLRECILSSGSLAPFIYILIYTLAPSLLLPGLPITIAGGILFGPFRGVVYTSIGSTLGACLAFLIARYAARGWVEGKLTSPRWRRLYDGVDRHGWKIVAFTRLIPLFPFNLLNYAFGLTRIGFMPYALTTFICMLPACISFIVFSSSLLDLLQGHVSANLIIGALLIMMISFTPAGYAKLRSKKKGRDRMW